MRIDRRTDLDARSQSVSDLQRARLLEQQLDQRRTDRTLDNRAPTRRTLLARREERTINQNVSRIVQIRIPQHDGRILPAHLELYAQFSIRNLAVQRIANRSRPGKRDTID